MRRLVFAEELGEVLEEADEDDEQGAGDSDEEEPGENDQGAMSDCEHGYRVQGAGCSVQGAAFRLRSPRSRG